MAVQHVGAPVSVPSRQPYAGPVSLSHVTRYGSVDKPFSGDGVQVSLARVPGLTPRGELVVPFRFMFPPHENIERTSAYAWPTFDVADENASVSQRARRGGRQLKQVQFSALFLPYAPGWAVWEPDDANPVMAARELEGLCERGVRFRLRVRNPRVFADDDVNIIAAFTQVQVTEQPGEPDARYVVAQIQEYRPTEMERKALRNEVGPWTHTIKSGDTLYALARRYYHRQSDWKLIAKANAGLEHQPPSHDLAPWAKRHHRKSLRVPQSPQSKTPVSA